MAQVGCNLSEEEAEDLEKYAVGMELTRPGICALLIHRELRRPQLAKLKSAPPAPYGVGRLKRVTVHIADIAFKKAFADHVRSLRLGSGEAAALLFRTELKERWVFKELSWHGNRP